MLLGLIMNYGFLQKRKKKKNKKREKKKHPYKKGGSARVRNQKSKSK